MEYGVIYTKICPKDGMPGDWIKYCHFLSETPKSFQENVKRIVDDINSIYKEYIVIPMDEDVHPGCTTKPDKVKEIQRRCTNNTQICVLDKEYPIQSEQCTQLAN